MADLPLTSIYLWPEIPAILPDRERLQDQRIYAVDNPSLIPFWPSAYQDNKTAVLIFPGGGYTRLGVKHEGEDIARWFAARGAAAFVVKYRLQEYGFPAALLDGLRAVRTLRKNAQAWGINPAAIGVVGFSAGGHVAGSVALRSDFRKEGEDPLVGIEARPDFAVLGYPVITLQGADAHIGSRNALLGEDPDIQRIRENSLQFQVKEGVPPMFVFHGVGDQAVPVTNSLNLFAGLIKYDRRSELHLYQTSVHGVGMIQGQGTVSHWPKAMEFWLQQNGFLPSSKDI